MYQDHPSEEFELLRRTSVSSESSLAESSYRHNTLTSWRQKTKDRFLDPLWFSLRRLRFPIPVRFFRQKTSSQWRPSRLRYPYLYPRNYYLSCILRIAIITAVALTLCTLFAAIFLPSYSNLPPHYEALERRCEGSESGRGNINNEKVFIAATLYDPRGHLAGGEWGDSIVELVDLLGQENVHVSVYENDADEKAQRALRELGNRLKCNQTLITETLPLSTLPTITIPTTNMPRIKRIAFLSYVRNQALTPLIHNPSHTSFAKLLYLNDVSFTPLSALHLLFSTKQDLESGKTQYGAACAVDFINPFKFYDRYATRDLEGYAMGVPFFPWFTNAGRAESRGDVLAQKDAVRVKSCWGGMTAFDAKWFQGFESGGDGDSDDPDEGFVSDKPTNLSKWNVAGLQIAPLRFRYELEPFWDASECCLIHADLAYLRGGSSHDSKLPDKALDTGIYTNPYVRVAYDPYTLSWLPYTRRIERLYPLIHHMVNLIAGLPQENPKRREEPGEEVGEWVWVSEHNATGEEERENNGKYVYEKRVVTPGRFCGSWKLSVLKQNRGDGEKNFEKLPFPKVPS